MAGTGRSYEPLVLGSVLLLAGAFLAVETFASPVVGTGAGCPPGATQWELLGVSLPVYQFTGVDFLQMRVTWSDGCNAHTGSLWLLLAGCLGLTIGGFLTMRAASGHRA